MVDGNEEQEEADQGRVEATSVQEELQPAEIIQEVPVQQEVQLQAPDDAVGEVDHNEEQEEAVQEHVEITRVQEELQPAEIVRGDPVQQAEVQQAEAEPGIQLQNNQDQVADGQDGGATQGEDGTQDQPLPPVDDLPTLETVHSPSVPTIQWVPKPARAEFSRVFASLCNKVAYNPDSIAGWILLSMFAKAILPAAPLRPDTTQARAVRDRLARWRQGDYVAL